MAKKKEPSFDDRTRSFFGHQAMALKSREAMKKAGVKEENLPVADYRFDSAAKLIEKNDRRRSQPKPKKMATGGKVTRGDGIAKKGHTRGKMR